MRDRHNIGQLVTTCSQRIALTTSYLTAAKPQRASRLVVRAEEAAAVPKAAPKKEVGPKRGSLVSKCPAPLYSPETSRR